MAAITIKDVTVKDRILLHLARYSNVAPGQEYNVPFDLTQDGIAMVVGITRSHASLDLKKLGDSGMVTYWQARQKGVKSKRLVYTITPEGVYRADETRRKLERGGINIDLLLDMKSCDPELKWSALSPQDREVFGKVCVMRVPIPRDTFPPTPTGTLPTDVYGLTFISPETSKVYLDKVSKEEVRRWNSWAADWWIDHDNIQERLHHLIAAERIMEAEKLVIRYKDELLSNPTEDLLRMLNDLDRSKPLEEELAWMKSQIAVAIVNMDEAKRCAKTLRKYRSPMEKIVNAQIHLYKGEYRDAFTEASSAYELTRLPLASILVAKAQVKSGELKNADQLLVRACESMHSIGDAKDIDEILVVRAEIAYRSSDRETAVTLLGKALVAAPEFRKGRIQNLIKLISTPGYLVDFT